MITMAENLLEECRLHAAEAEEQVRAQTQRIAELRSAGEDTEEAERLLRSLEQMAACCATASRGKKAVPARPRRSADFTSTRTSAGRRCAGVAVRQQT